MPSEASNKVDFQNLEFSEQDLVMDPDERMYGRKPWSNPSSSSLIDGFKDLSRDNPSLSNFASQQHNWHSSSYIEQECPGFRCPSETSSLGDRSNGQRADDNLMREDPDSSKTQDWDPRGTLNNLSFLEQKVHQLRDLVHVIIGRREQAGSISSEILVQQQHLITADLTSIIVQLISTAGGLLPSVKNNNLSSVGPFNQSLQFNGSVVPSGSKITSNPDQPQSTVNKVEDHSSEIDHTVNCRTEPFYTIDDHELKDEDDVDEGENLAPGSYEILQLEKEEILAPHTHFCTICGKGFKRDANLRMHMRGHGDEYKTPAALAKPLKESSSEPTLIKRYSCPYGGCKRNKDHKKFQPLKTILCVKNHYKRTHCDKRYTCSRCHTKKFSVIADLKTHEKHCGRDRWLCSCGTTFSRKDKLFGHITLFQGHTPAIPMDDSKASIELVDGGQTNEEGNKVEQVDFCVQPSSQNPLDEKDKMSDQPTSYFSPLNFDPSNLNGYHEFPRAPYEESEGSFSFLLSGSSEYS